MTRLKRFDLFTSSQMHNFSSRIPIVDGHNTPNIFHYSKQLLEYPWMLFFLRPPTLGFIIIFLVRPYSPTTSPLEVSLHSLLEAVIAHKPLEVVAAHPWRSCTHAVVFIFLVISSLFATDVSSLLFLHWDCFGWLAFFISLLTFLLVILFVPRKLVFSFILIWSF